MSEQVKSKANKIKIETKFSVFNRRLLFPFPLLRSFVTLQDIEIGKEKKKKNEKEKEIEEEKEKDWIFLSFLLTAVCQTRKNERISLH